mgnify:CR=1 FL=1
MRWVLVLPGDFRVAQAAQLKDNTAPRATGQSPNRPNGIGAIAHVN